MTPADLELCRALAKAEGQIVSSNGQYVEGRTEEDGDIWYVSNYLTDATETLRMLTEIRRCSTAHEWEEFSRDLWLRNAIPIPHAIAEATLAMLTGGKEKEDA